MPQFLVLYKRKNTYPKWVLAFTILAGAEGTIENKHFWIKSERERDTYSEYTYSESSRVCMPKITFAPYGMLHV